MKSFYKVLLAATLLSPIFSFAQGNYRQGFVITQKGDTVKGYIDLKEWSSNPTDINFKAALDKSPARVFTLNDIDYFEIPNVTAYRRFTTSISLDETNIQRLQHERDISKKIATVLLKQEQRGKNVTLYSYQDNLKERFYISDNQAGNVTELTYRIYFVANNANNVSTTSQNAYKQQLLLLAQRFDTYNDNIRSLIEEAEYQRSDLKAICGRINNSKEIQNSNKKNFVGFFASIGGSYDKVDMKGSFPLYNLDKKSKSSFSPRISAGINLYPVPDVRRSVIKIEFAYFSDSFETTGEPYFNNSQAKSTYSFQQHTFSIIPQFQYDVYHSDPLKVYLDAGLAINLSSYSGDSYVNTVTNETESDFGLSKKWFSFPFKAGIILNKKLDVSLTYIYQQSISDNVSGTHQNYNYSFNLQSVQFGIGYIF